MGIVWLIFHVIETAKSGSKLSYQIQMGQIIERVTKTVKEISSDLLEAIKTRNLTEEDTKTYLL
ncbi:hypothetical protein ACM26V_22300 [Salipaludibacillus sp. HK11]|uniref:hypothetical protein n=1 Tax=Salipaludibacillus sp. HK11 TaxID=3394320 RepID=UPI0039FDB40C